jgi:hypothetical protein
VSLRQYIASWLDYLYWYTVAAVLNWSFGAAPNEFVAEAEAGYRACAMGCLEE